MDTRIHMVLQYLEEDGSLFLKEVFLDNIFKNIPFDLVSKSILTFDGFSLGHEGSVVGDVVSGVITKCYEYGSREETMRIYFEILFENFEECEKFYKILKNNGFERYRW